MHDFLYFFENRKSFNNSAADELELSYIYQGSGRSIQSRECKLGSAGPTGNHGVFFGVRNSSLIRFQPDKQKWTPHPNIEGLHVGYDTDSRPNAQGLARNDMLKGHTWTDHNDRKWIIPVARWVGPDGYRHALPRELNFDGEQFMPGNVVEKYSRLWEIGEAAANSIDGEDVVLKFSDAIPMCVDALAFNYRISSVEFALAGIAQWDIDSIWGILSLVIDTPGLVQMSQKKNGSLAIHKAWANGLLPGYQPTFANLRALQ